MIVDIDDFFFDIDDLLETLWTLCVIIYFSALINSSIVDVIESRKH